MKRVLLLVLLGACASPDAPAPPPSTLEPAPDRVVAAPDPAASMPLTLRAKFEPAGSDPLHVVAPDDLTEDGPLVGNELGREDLDYLDEQLRAMAGYESLHAVYEVGGGLFVLRGPGVDVPNNLFLADWDGGAAMLRWVADLAYAHCGPDECASQQAWLTDLDGDGRRDVVRRARLEDLATGAVDETLEAWLVTPTGALRSTDLAPEDRARYRAG